MGNSFQGCSLCIRSEINDKFQNHFNEYFHHDWLLNIYASEVAGMYFYNEALFQYRIHEENTLGVTILNQSAKEHVNQSKTLEERTALAKSVLDVLEIIKVNCSWFYENKKDYYNGFEVFLSNHISYLKNKNFFRLLLQNSSPYYRKIKSYRARIMDLLYCLK